MTSSCPAPPASIATRRPNANCRQAQSAVDSSSRPWGSVPRFDRRPAAAGRAARRGRNRCNPRSRPAASGSTSRSLLRVPARAPSGSDTVRRSGEPRGDGSAVQALGAEVRPWGNATECCGGGLTLTRPRLRAVWSTAWPDGARSRSAGHRDQLPALPGESGDAPGRSWRPDADLLLHRVDGPGFRVGGARTWWPKHLIYPRPLLQAAGLAMSRE